MHHSEDDLSNALRQALDAEGIQLVEIESRPGQDLMDTLGTMALSNAMRQAFIQLSDTLDTITTACLAMCVVPDYRRNKIAENLGVDFKLLRRAGIRLYRVRQLMYEAAAPGADEPEMIDKYIQSRRDLIDARNKFIKDTAVLAAPGEAR